MAINNSKGQLTYQLDIDKQQVNGFPIPCDFYSTGKIGVLYPTQALEVNYGNKIDNLSSAAVQFNPLAVPIMANMYQKQEHYYTPYIDVWDNFDNFISGGEDGNFNTPPPSFTFQQLVGKLVSLFGLAPSFSVLRLADGTYSFPTTGSIKFGQGEYVYMKIPDKGVFETRFSSQSYGFFSGNGLSDIYSHFVLAKFNQLMKSIDEERKNIELWKKSTNATTESLLVSPDGKYLWSRTEGNGFALGDYILFYVSTDATIANTAVNPYAISRLVDVDYKNPYYRELGSTLQYYSNNLSTPFDGEFAITDFGMSYFRNYYGIYKPFCGVGSYLDCLNIGRFTETDFFLMFFVSFMKAYDLGTGEVELDPDVCSDMPKSALVLRVLYLIWYNNYRDQLLETSALKPRKTDDVTDQELIILTIPRVRCWEKDSYTTALDNPATADAVVPIGVATHETAKVFYRGVKGVGANELLRNDGTVVSVNFSDGETLKIPTGLISGYLGDGENSSTSEGNYKNYLSLHLLDATRRAQSFMRKALFYGNRIQDFIYTTYAVKYLDARLRLPEILSASSEVVELNTLVNNTTTAESVAGDRAGYAKGYDKGNGFSRYCEEAGVIISMFTIMPEPTYAYGSDRKYSRLDRFDFPIPDFATLGMDAVFDCELTDTAVKVAVDGATVSSYPLVFGYQGRYYDSKFRQSTEHGELLTTQDMYTFGRKWNMYNPSSRPKLNYEFVHCFPALDMFVLEDGTEDYFRFNVHHDTLAHIALPYHSIYMS